MGSEAMSFGRAVLIVNPRAGGGRVAREMPEVERELLARRIDHRIVETEGPGHAVALTREALEAGERFVVAVGGDGTVHEVVNGMLPEGRPLAHDAVLGVVAAGSGSDFVKTFGLPGDSVRAVRHLAGDRTYQIDAVRVSYRDGDGQGHRCFVNIGEAGLGAAVVRRAARLPRRMRGGRYFVGFWIELARYRPGEIRLRADRKEWTGRAVNVIVANCQFFGNGMRISPRSYPGDGLLDVQINHGPKSEAFTLLPKIYRGEHVPHPHIKELRGAVVEVEGDRPLALEADGESLGTTPARFEILPQVLTLKI